MKQQQKNYFLQFRCFREYRKEIILYNKYCNIKLYIVNLFTLLIYSGLNVCSTSCVVNHFDGICDLTVEILFMSNCAFVKKI